MERLRFKTRLKERNSAGPVFNLLLRKWGLSSETSCRKTVAMENSKGKTLEYVWGT